VVTGRPGTRWESQLRKVYGKNGQKYVRTQDYKEHGGVYLSVYKHNNLYHKMTIIIV